MTAPSSDTLKAIVVYNPLDPEDRAEAELVWQSGRTLAQYLDGLPDGVIWEVALDGVYIPREGWNLTLPAPNATIIVAPVPEGGGDGKSILAIAATLALNVFAPIAGGFIANAFFGGAKLAATVASAAVAVAGGLLIAGMIPKPESMDAGNEQSYGIDGPKNTSTEGVPVPVLYGRHAWGGNYVDLYTENATDESGDPIQYLYGRVLVSEGPISGFESFKINDLPIEDFENVEIDYRLGNGSQSVSPWFNRTITPYNQARDLTENWQGYTTSQEVDQLRLDFVCPTGLYKLNNDGDRKSRSVDLEIRYRKQGETDWLPFVAEGIWSKREAEQDVADAFRVVWTLHADPLHDPFARGQTATTQSFDGRIEYRPHGVSGATWQTGAQISKSTDGRTGAEVVTPIQTPGSGAFDFRIVKTSGNGSATVERVEINQAIGNLRIKDRSSTPVRRSFRSTTLPEAVYEIEYRRTSPEADANDRVFDKVQLADVNEIILEKVALQRTAWAGFKIRLDGQIGSIPTFSGIATGRLIPVHDHNGDLVQIVPSSNPADVLLDIYLNDIYGASYESERIDWAAHAEWRDWCVEKGYEFNAWFSDMSNVDEVAKHVYRVGRAQRVTSGARVSVAIDRPADPVMMFTQGNIGKSSFEITYIPLADRINDLEVAYFDEDADFKRRSVREINYEAINRGDALKSTSIFGTGITKRARAEEEAQLMMNNNRLVHRIASWESPIEAVGCTVGDVVLVQHEMPRWGTGGRLKAESSSIAELKLDQTVAVDASKSHRVLVHQNAAKLADVQIISQSANLISVDTLLDRDKTRRLVVAGGEYAILRCIPGATSTDLVIENSLPAVNGLAAEIWTTDLIEEKTVNVQGMTNAGLLVDGEADTILLDTPLSQTPHAFAQFMFGETASESKAFRITRIGRDQDGMVPITAVEYVPEAYSTAPGSPATYDPPLRVGQVSNLAGEQELVPGPGKTPQLRAVATWQAPEQGVYMGAEIQVSVDSEPYRTVTETTGYRYEHNGSVGDSISIRVVAMSEEGRASVAKAPVVSVTLGAREGGPPVPTGWSAISGFDTITLQGDASADRYFSHFVIYADSGTSADFQKIGETRDTRFMRRPPHDDTFTRYVVAAVDVFGEQSAFSNYISVTTIVPPQEQGNPDVPSGLSVTSELTEDGRAVMTATWNAVTNVSIAGYDVRARRSGVNANWVSLTTSETTHEWTSLRGTTYDVSVRTRGSLGLLSAWTPPVSHTVVADEVPPATPTGVSLIAGFETIWVEWNANSESDLSHYEIVLKDSSATPGASDTIRRSSATTLSFTGLPEGETRYVFVRAVDTSGNASDWTAPESATTTTLDLGLPVPVTPAGLSASSEVIENGRARLVVGWNSVSDAATYELGITRSGGNESVISLGGTDYESEQAVAGASYSLRVRALNGNGNPSPWSAATTIVATADTTPPATPTGLSVTEFFGSLWFQWNGNGESDFSHYLIELQTAGNPIRVDGQSYLLQGLDDGATRQLRVRAVDTSGNVSTWSSWVSGTTVNLSLTRTPPSAPGNLSVSSDVIDDGRARIVASWNSVTDAARYEVGVRRGVAAETILPVGSTEWETEQAIPGVDYTIRVRALNDVGAASSWSANQTISAATDGVAPPTVSNLSAEGALGTIWLSWDHTKPADFSHYEIYEGTTTTAPTAGTEESFTTISKTFARTGLPKNTATTRYYWVRAVDASGNKSGWSGRRTATTKEIESADVAGLIEETSFAANLSPVKVVSSLPSSKQTEIVSFNGELYRWDGSDYVKSINTDDLAGQVQASQIADVGAGQISGQLSDSQIADLSSAKLIGQIINQQLATGSVTPSKLSVMDAANLVPDAEIEETDSWTIPSEFSHVHPTSVSVKSRGRIEYVHASGRTGWSQPITSSRFPVSEGDVYAVRYVLWRKSSTTSKVFGRVHWFDSSGNALPSPDDQTEISNDTSSTALKEYTKQITAPSKARTAELRWYVRRDETFGDVSVGGPYFRKATDETMLSDGAVGVSKFAGGLRPVETLSSLPTSGNEIGRTVMLTTDGKLYRYTSAGWTAAVPAADIEGQVQSAQIAALEAAKITGQITETQITDDSISTPKIAAGAVNASHIEVGSVEAGKIATGAVVAGNIATDAIEADNIQTNAITSAKIAAGAVTASKAFIGDTSNIFVDNEFEDPDAWVHNSDVFDFIDNPYPGQISAKRVVDVTPSVTGGGDGDFVTNAYPRHVPCNEGDEFWFSGYIRGISSGTEGRYSINSRFLDSDGNMIESNSFNAVIDPQTGETHYDQAKVVAPPGAAYVGARIRVGTNSDGNATGRVFCWGIEIRRAVSGSMIVDGTITADNIQTNAITSAKIAAGAVTTSKLTVGSTNNLLHNARFLAGLSGWVATHASDTTTDPLTIRDNASHWGTPAKPTLQLRQRDDDQNGHVDVRQWRPGTTGAESRGWPVRVGETVEASAYISAHRCKGELRIQFYDDTGGTVSYSPTAENDSDQGDPDPDTFPRLVTRAVVPAGAVNATIHIRKLPTNVGEADSWLFIYKPLLGLTLENATEPLEWSPGGFSMIDGDAIVTGSIDASHIQAGSIDATHINAGEINASHLATDSVTTAAIETGAVGADQIAANAIRASKILVSDTSNILVDNSLEDQDAWVINTQVMHLIDNPYPSNIPVNRVIEANPSVTGGGDRVFVANAYPRPVPCNEGDEFWFSGYLRGIASGTEGFYSINARFHDHAGNMISSPGVFNVTDPQVEETHYGEAKFVAPPDTAYVTLRARVGTNHAGNATGKVFFWGLQIRRAVSGNMIVDGTIEADQINVTSFLTVDEAFINEAHISGTLNADKISAGTQLANSITVDGEQLKTVKDKANDPASQVNTGSTQIDPGKIIVSGSTTLSDWRGGDTTKIDGGKIETSSVTTDQLAAGAVTTSKLSVMDASNIIPDADIQDIDAWRILPPFQHIQGTVVQIKSKGRIAYIHDGGTGWTTHVETSFFPVSGSDTYAFRYVLQTHDGATARVLGQVHWFDGNGSSLPSPDHQTEISDDTLVNTGKECSAQLTAPATAKLATIRWYVRKEVTTGNVSIGGPYCRKASDEVMISDGAITASKLTSGEVITQSAQIKDATINDAHIIDLSAAKLTTGSALAGSITVDGTALSTVNSRAENNAPSVGVKINHNSFTSQNNGEGYVHGFDADGNAANVDGWISHNGEKLTLPNHRFLTSTSNPGPHPLIFDMSGSTFVSGNNTSPYAIAKKLSSGQWQYDTNSAEGWANFTPNANRVVVGDVKIESADLIESARMFSHATPLDQYYEADRVNAGETRIEPGRISVSGSTTLSDWRKGDDETRIDGGAISANTVSANKITIGSRGIHVQGIVFSTDGNKLSWTDGAIRYRGDDGNYVFQSISSGDVTWTGGLLHIFWQKGSSTINYTGSPNSVMEDDNRVPLAVYTGGTDLTTNTGRTMINGDYIQTNTINASHIDTGSITANEIGTNEIIANTANIKNGVITNAKINNLDANKITAGTALSGSVRVSNSALSTVVKRSETAIFSVSFDEEDFDLWTAYSDQTLSAYTADKLSGRTQSARIFDNSTGPSPGGMLGGVVRAQLPESFAKANAGKRIRVSVVAKNGPGTSTTEFGVAFSTNSVGNSGWNYFSPTTDWRNFRFYYQLPDNLSGPSYVGIWADTSGSGKELLVDSVTVEQSSEDWADDPASRVNERNTQIDPGKIVISGATSLADWRGSDTTTIKGGAIETGTITADKLTVGGGGNLFEGSQWQNGLNSAYKVGATPGTNLSMRSPGSTHSGKTFPVLQVYQNNADTNGHIDVRLTKPDGDTDVRVIPVEPGRWYEFHARVSNHRANGSTVRLMFRDIDGNFAGEAAATIATVMGDGSNPDKWPVYWVKMQAPSNAAFITPVIRKLPTSSGSSSYLFVHKPYVGETHADATEPTPWSPGNTTVIDGDSIKTGTLSADRVKIDNVTLDTDGSGNLTVKGGGITTQNIAEGSVVATAHVQFSGATMVPSDNVWLTPAIAYAKIERTAGVPTVISFGGQLDGQPPTAGDPTGGAAIKFRVLRDGVPVRANMAHTTGYRGSRTSFQFTVEDTNTGSDTVRFEVQAQRTIGLWTGLTPRVINPWITVTQFKR